MKYLGIDYGTKRIGVAISDDNGRIAFPNSILTNDTKLITNLKKIISENSINKVIIGESKNYKMEDNEIMGEIFDLKKILEMEFEIDVELHSEILTSVEVLKSKNPIKAPVNNKRRDKSIHNKKTNIDSSAAAIILQSYLDLKNKKINL